MTEEEKNDTTKEKQGRGRGRPPKNYQKKQFSLSNEAVTMLMELKKKTGKTGTQLVESGIKNLYTAANI